MGKDLPTAFQEGLDAKQAADQAAANAWEETNGSRLEAELAGTPWAALHRILQREDGVRDFETENASLGVTDNGFGEIEVSVLFDDNSDVEFRLLFTPNQPDGAAYTDQVYLSRREAALAERVRELIQELAG
jgi:hypothetical protein